MKLDQLAPADIVAAAPAIFRFNLDNDPALLIVFTDGTVVLPSLRYRVNTDPQLMTKGILAATHGKHIKNAYIILLAPIGPDLPLAVNLSLSALSALTMAQIHTRAQLRVERIERNAQWTDLRTGQAGTLPDPATTAAAMAGLLRPVVNLPNLHDIRALFTPAAPVTVSDADADAARPDFPAETLGELVQLIRAYAIYDPQLRQELIADLNESRTATAPLAARLAYLLRDNESAPDAIIGLGLIDVGAAATVYTELANQLTGTDRAYLLTAVAIFHYSDRRGAHAHEALRYADIAVTDARTDRPPLLKMMMSAYESAIEPTQATKLLLSGKQVAYRFGFDVQTLCW
ncbi:DUF4192 family protein [Nocardia brasiliensis]|uniref:DUF4192 family protein n=1 Tax=Nocardia brasiliensis TaxID=37326 RepID=UPI002454E5C7|nr:DUF4192 family protein [Nocardia brasiliensis]